MQAEPLNLRGVVVRGKNVIAPSALKRRAVDIAHESHPPNRARQANGTRSVLVAKDGSGDRGIVYQGLPHLKSDQNVGGVSFSTCKGSTFFKCSLKTRCFAIWDVAEQQ